MNKKLTKAKKIKNQTIKNLFFLTSSASASWPESNRAIGFDLFLFLHNLILIIDNSSINKLPQLRYPHAAMPHKQIKL